MGRNCLALLLLFLAVTAGAWEPPVDKPAAWPPHYTEQWLAMNPRTGEAVLLGLDEPHAALDCWSRLEGAWVKRAGPNAAPPARRGATLVFDIAMEKFVLHGGQSLDGSILSDTWLFDMTDWTQWQGAAPPARRLHGAAYDPKREVVVIYGGRGADNVRRDDTWEFTTDGWRQIDTPGPPARYLPAMAYDNQSQHVILFAGYSINGHSSDTWSFDGSTWMELSAGVGQDGAAPTDVPPGSMGVAAASNPYGGIVVTGGMYGIGDVWRWLDGQWSVLRHADQQPGPGQRLGATLCFDPFREAFIYGGGDIRASNAPGQDVADCRGWWQLDAAGEKWTRLESH